MGKMRVTQHSGRVRKGGQAFSTRHNDRDFDVTESHNINANKTRCNLYWTVASKRWYSDENKSDYLSFADAEKGYYKAHFKAMYDASVERSRKRGQLKRVKPFDQWMQARQFLPEEMCLQIGNADESVDSSVLWDCFKDYLHVMNDWNRAHGKPFQVLNAALHCDEATPHLHIRRVWHSVNPDTGIEEIGQAKALERAGIPLPDQAKPCGKGNNRKMTFDAYMRNAWIGICKAHGLDIEDTPLQGVKHNQTKEEWLEGKLKERANALNARESRLNAFRSDLEAESDRLSIEKANWLKTQNTAFEELRKRKAELDAREAEMGESIKLGRMAKVTDFGNERGYNGSVKSNGRDVDVTGWYGHGF